MMLIWFYFMKRKKNPTGKATNSKKTRISNIRSLALGCTVLFLNMIPTAANVTAKSKMPVAIFMNGNQSIRSSPDPIGLKSNRSILCISAFHRQLSSATMRRKRSQHFAFFILRQIIKKHLLRNREVKIIQEMFFVP